MAISNWTLGITDSNGSLLPYDSFATVMRITQTWNGPRVFEATIPLTSPIVALLSLGNQFVIATRREGANDVVRFHGILWSRSITYATTGAQMTITAVDPWSILAKRYTSANYVAQDQGAIAKALVVAENAISNTYIGTSLTPAATVTRDRSWAENPRPVSEAIQSLTTILDPIDIDLVPRAYSAGTICDLTITPRVVVPPPVFTFGWGTGTVENCNNVTDDMSMDDVGNYEMAFGSGGITSTKSDTASVSKYGRLTRQDTFDSVIEQTTLDANAQDMVNTYRTPLPTVKVTPRRGADVMLWDNFNVGSGVYVDARFNGLATFISARVIEASVEVDATSERVIDVTLQEARG